MTSALRLIAAPAPTYAALVRMPRGIGALAALRRPLLVAVIVGCTVAILATRHAPAALVVSTTLCWSPVVLVQIAIALAAIAGPARRTIGVPRALDLFFASHTPWSLWMLAVIAYGPSAADRSLLPILLPALVPLALTARMLVAFFREVLGLGAREAMVRTLVHQAVTWSLLLILFGAAVAIVPRILQHLG
jgi:hypothetical protein